MSHKNARLAFDIKERSKRWSASSYLSALRRANVSLIVRAAQARRTTKGASAETGQRRVPTQDLFKAMNTAKVVGTRRIEIEREKKLDVIELQVKVYAAQVHRPKHFGSGSGLADTIPIWVVESLGRRASGTVGKSQRLGAKCGRSRAGDCQVRWLASKPCAAGCESHLERTLRPAVSNDGFFSRFISKKYATRLAFNKQRDVLAKPKQGEVNPMWMLHFVQQDKSERIIPNCLTFSKLFMLLSLLAAPRRTSLLYLCLPTLPTLCRRAVPRFV